MRIKITLSVSREFTIKDPQDPMQGVQAYEESVHEDPHCFIDANDAEMTVKVEQIDE